MLLLVISLSQYLHAQVILLVSVFIPIHSWYHSLHHMKGRDILQLRCQYHSPQEKNAQSAVSSSPPILALSSHLESTKASSEVRIAQLVQMAQLVYDLGRTGVALIAGEMPI